MAILAIGGTGQVGSLVVGELARRGGEVRVLSQKPDEAKLPQGVSAVKGDVLDMDSLRGALKGVDTLFLLNPVVADELTRALLALRLAQDAGVKGVVYFSMVNADTFSDTPHAAAKYAGERMIEAFDLPATILRPNCFFQNDAMVKDPLLQKGVYAMPIGSVGVAMADLRDIAEVAALELLRRDRAPGPLPRNLIDISGPENLTAASVCAIWSDVLGRAITYGGNDTGPLEAQSAEHMPSGMALDIALMLRGFQRMGMLPQDGAPGRVAEMIGKPLRTYRAFAEEMAASWKAC